MFCLRCGTEVPSDTVKCPKCGMGLRRMGSAEEADGEGNVRREKESSSAGLWSLILGILSFALAGPLMSIPGFVLGIVGLRRGGGNGLAIAGMVICGVNIALSLVFIVFLLKAFTGGQADFLSSMQYDAFSEAETRSAVARVRSDLRSLATGLESYHIDNNSFPAWTTEQAQSVNAGFEMGEMEFPTFTGRQSGLWTLTTPIPYLANWPADPFSIYEGTTFAYYAPAGDDPTSRTWIVWSPGPDYYYDLHSENISELFHSPASLRSASLIDYIYDPTNGIESDGDIVRVRQ